MQSDEIQSAGILYERYKRVLWVFFYNNSGSTFKSEEMVQITFEKIIKYSKSFQYKGTVKSWIFSIARNVLNEQWKNKREHDSLEEIKQTEKDTKPTGDDLLIQKERNDLITKAIQRLTPEKRELLSMIKLQELSYKEVAIIYGLSVATLKVRIFRIITELKQYMKDINAQEHY